MLIANNFSELIGLDNFMSLYFSATVKFRLCEVMLDYYLANNDSLD